MNLTSLQLFAGTSWSWTETPADYPAPDYSLQIILKLGTNAAISLNGVAQDDGSFKFTKPSGETSLLSHGTYAYQVLTTDSASQTHLLESGTIHIYPLLSSNADTRSYWQIILDNYKEAYRRLSERETDSVSVDGDEVTFQNRAELLGMIRRAEREVAKENGTAAPRIIKSRW